VLINNFQMIFFLQFCCTLYWYAHTFVICSNKDDLSLCYDKDFCLPDALPPVAQSVVSDRGLHGVM